MGGDAPKQGWPAPYTHHAASGVWGAVGSQKTNAPVAEKSKVRDEADATSHKPITCKMVFEEFNVCGVPPAKLGAVKVKVQSITFGTVKLPSVPSVVIEPTTEPAPIVRLTSYMIGTAFAVIDPKTNNAVINFRICRIALLPELGSSLNKQQMCQIAKLLPNRNLRIAQIIAIATT